MLAGIWTAIDRPTGSGRSERELFVEGVLDVPSTAHQARLERAVPQGINPAILVLDLIVEQIGIGAAVITSRTVEFHERPVDEGQFRQVSVRNGDTSVALIDVSISKP